MDALELGHWSLVAGVAVIGIAVYLMLRRVEVRLVLIGAGALLAAFAGAPLMVADTFTTAMIATMVAPICASMGFASVLSMTGADRALVELMLVPARRAPWALIPLASLGAYLVNIAVPSQASTAAALGPIVMPMMAAAGVMPTVGAAALVLGASFGGDLLSPGAQDVHALAATIGVAPQMLSARLVPASLAGVMTAVIVFFLLTFRRHPVERVEAPEPSVAEANRSEPYALFVMKAMVPLLPITMLLLAYGGFGPLQWLIATDSGTDQLLTGALPVVRAMIIGSVVAAALNWREVQRVTRGLFGGMGSAYGDIISLTIAAQCFGTGIAVIGLGQAILEAVDGTEWALSGLSVTLPWGLALFSGSGSGPVLAFGQTFLAPLGAGETAPALASLTCLAAAFGRTMSPISAVVVYSSGLFKVSPIALVKQVAPALMAGALVAMTVCMMAG